MPQTQRPHTLKFSLLLAALLCTALLCATSPNAHAQASAPQAAVLVELQNQGQNTVLAHGTVTPGQPLRADRAPGGGISSEIKVRVGFQGCGNGQIGVQLSAITSSPSNPGAVQRATNLSCRALPPNGTITSQFEINGQAKIIVAITPGISA